MSNLGFSSMLEEDPETITLSDIDISHIDLGSKTKSGVFSKG